MISYLFHGFCSGLAFMAFLTAAIIVIGAWYLLYKVGYAILWKAKSYQLFKASESMLEFLKQSSKILETKDLDENEAYIHRRMTNMVKLLDRRG